MRVKPTSLNAEEDMKKALENLALKAGKYEETAAYHQGRPLPVALTTSPYCGALMIHGARQTTPKI